MKTPQIYYGVGGLALLVPAFMPWGAVRQTAPQDGTVELAKRAQALLKQRCYHCHGQNGVANKNVFVLDRKRLVADRIVIANDVNSPLLRSVESGSMPVDGARLTRDEVELLREWIKKGAPEAGETTPAKTKTFLTEEALVGLIEQDLKRIPADSRAGVRYFSIAHLANSGVPDEELEGYRIGLSRLLNSLSWQPAIARPKPIDPGQTIFRISLADYRWEARTWQAILDVYPYAVQTPASIRINALSGVRLPYVRADWFVAQASVPPLYHDILELPKTLVELQQMLGVDVQEDYMVAGKVLLGGVRDSGVSRNNRVLQRHSTRHGAFWMSYDFRSNQGEQNIFRDPLNFKANGGEFIFNLPNGLQAYYICDDAGKRLNSAPVDIVADRNHPNEPVVTNGRSCMGCHNTGIRPFKDVVRGIVEKQPATDAYDVGRALALYVVQKDLDRRFEEDTERFRKATSMTGGVFSADFRTEPINALAQKYGSELTVAQAAAETGLTVKAFQEKIALSRKLNDLGFGQLLGENGGYKRDAWEEHFRDAVTELGIGSYVKPALETARRGMLLVCCDDWPPRFDAYPPEPSLKNKVKDVTTYIQNIASLFAGGRRGKFLILPQQDEFFGDPFVHALEQAGHSVQRTGEVKSLDEYDGLFLCVSKQIDRAAIVAYINRGGKVYISTGAGNWEFWQPVVNTFGMQLLPDNSQPFSGNNSLLPVSGHPLFNGVGSLLIGGISAIKKLPGDWPNTEMILTRDKLNLWGLYVSDPIRVK